MKFKMNLNVHLKTFIKNPMIHSLHSKLENMIFWTKLEGSTIFKKRYVDSLCNYDGLDNEIESKDSKPKKFEYHLKDYEKHHNNPRYEEHSSQENIADYENENSEQFCTFEKSEESNSEYKDESYAISKDKKSIDNANCNFEKYLKSNRRTNSTFNQDSSFWNYNDLPKQAWFKNKNNQHERVYNTSFREAKKIKNFSRIAKQKAFRKNKITRNF